MSTHRPRPTRHQPHGLRILHEDRDILVVDKAQGLLSVGTESGRCETAHSRLNDYVRKGCAKSRQRVFIVHRLDRDTSGVMVFARSAEVQGRLQDGWESTEKHYLAVVHGRPERQEGVITSYLAENATHRVYSTPDQALGRLSRTAYRVVRTVQGRSLLDITLLTGRKHQIRVHLSEQGFPVVGDDRYGRGRDSCDRLALHARSIAFDHPVTGRRMFCEAAVPARIERLVPA